MAIGWQMQQGMLSIRKAYANKEEATSLSKFNLDGFMITTDL